MKNILVLFLFTLSSLAAYAQNRVGNGGDVLVCDKKPKSRTVQLLDLYELEMATPKKELYKLSLEKMNAWEASEEILGRMKSFAPKLFEQYKARLVTIQAELDFKSEVRLVNIKDSEHLFLPKSQKCELFQIAVRKNTVTKEEKRFVIDQELWNELSVLHRSGLIIHEIVYEHLFKLGEFNSVKARKVVGLIYSADLDSKRFWKLIQELELPIYP